MTEATFQTLFSKWLRYNAHVTALYELKLVKGPSMPFSAVQPHQLEALQYAKHDSIVYKIPDSGNSQKPADCFKLTGVYCDVVIMFYQKGVKHFYMIDIDDFMHEMNLPGRKSLTEKRASEIGIRAIIGDIEPKFTAASKKTFV